MLLKIKIECVIIFHVLHINFRKKSLTLTAGKKKSVTWQQPHEQAVIMQAHFMETEA